MTLDQARSPRNYLELPRTQGLAIKEGEKTKGNGRDVAEQGEYPTNLNRLLLEN